jgi:hypothetical protein
MNVDRIELILLLAVTSKEKSAVRQVGSNLIPIVSPYMTALIVF